MAKKRVLIICGAGMTSSVIAKLTGEKLNSLNDGNEYIVDSFDEFRGKNSLKNGEWDVYLMSPQIRMYHHEFTKIAEDTNQVVKSIPPKDYVPVPKKIEIISNLALEALNEFEQTHPKAKAN